jgi:hypothetical protein
MEAVISALEQFAGANGKFYNEFYIGIAGDPVDRLINGHGVNSSIPHIYWKYPFHTDITRSIEKFFLNKGTKGGDGGGDEETCYIYMYKITPNTRE